MFNGVAECTYSAYFGNGCEGNGVSIPTMIYMILISGQLPLIAICFVQRVGAKIKQDTVI